MNVNVYGTVEGAAIAASGDTIVISGQRVTGYGLRDTNGEAVDVTPYLHIGVDDVEDFVAELVELADEMRQPVTLTVEVEVIMTVSRADALRLDGGGDTFDEYFDVEANYAKDVQSFDWEYVGHTADL